MKLCDPWETQTFIKEFDQMPTDQCNHCLPDCNTAIYDTQITNTLLPSCDHSTLGSSELCKLLLDSDLKPEIWTEKILKQYEKNNITLPGYFKKLSNPIRKLPNDIFSLDEENESYNAYEQDIAIVNFFYNKPTTMKYLKFSKTTFDGFLSQIGGSWGLYLGISLMSVLEIIYWFTFGLCKSMKKKKKSAK